MARKGVFLALVLILNISGILGNEVHLSTASPVSVKGEGELLSEISEYSLYLPSIRNDYDWASLKEWTPWAFQDNVVSQIYSGPGSEELWVIADNELYQSNNYGFDWHNVDTGNYLPEFFAVDKHSDNGILKFVATRYGEVLSSVDLVNWKLELDQSYTSSTFFDWVEEDLYLGRIQWGFEELQSQIYRRSPNGVWEIVGNPLPSVVNGLSVFLSTIYAGTNNGLYRLEDSEWIPVFVYDTEEPIMVKKFIVHNGILIIGTISPRGIYSTHDGINWMALDVGLTNAWVVNIRQIVASGSGTLFAAADDGVFMSANNGERWQVLDTGLLHTITGYGVLLENIQATSLSIIRDFPNEQTLAATFNNKGLWLLTVNKNTWLSFPRPSAPPKAILVVGPIDPPLHTKTQYYISQANRLADIMQRNGMQVVKVYWPNSNWENVRAAIGGASIVVYKGHGFSAGEPGEDPTEFYGGTNGFCLVNLTDPEGAILATQDMLVTTNRLAENAISFFSCCFCSGPSATDPSPVPEDWARWRIEAYSSTVLRMDGRGYFSGVNEEAILNAFFSNLDKPIGEIYKSVQGTPDHISTHTLASDIVIWFDGSITENWGEAYVGDPNLTPRQVLGW